MKNLKIKIFSEFSDELRYSWKEVEKKSSIFVFQTFDINEYWYSIFGNDKNLILQIAVIYKDNESIAIFPLMIRNIKFSKVLEFIGSRQFDYKIPLIVQEYNTYLDLTNIWDLVKSNMCNYDVIFFQSLPEKLSNQKLNHFINLFNSKTYTSSYSLSLPEKLEYKNKVIPKKVNADSKRQLKRLENLGILNFHKIKNIQKHSEAIKILIGYKKEQFKDTGATNVFLNSQIKEFYLNSKNADIHDIQIDLSVLQLNNKIIAVHWGLVHKNTFYYLMPSYDKSMSIYSPGRLLMEFLIEKSIIKGLEIFDLTIGAEEYKKKYSTTKNKINYVLELNSYRAIIFYIYSEVIMRAKSNEKMKSFFRRLKKMIVK